jgi:hypothetical protein
MSTGASPAPGFSSVYVHVLPTSTGCGSPDSRHSLIIDTPLPWTRVRFTQYFNGYASCWAIFGEASYAPDANLHPYSPTLDVVRMPYRMGGSAGDAYSPPSSRCDNTSTNFWAMSGGSGTSRYATVVLRRRDATMPAGLGTGVSCNTVTGSTGGAATWQYTNIWVR